MLRILLTILFLSFSILPSFAIDQWTPTAPQSGDNPQVYPAAAQMNNNSLSRILANYRQSAYLTYNNATSINILAGEVACNSSTPYVFRQNTSTVVGTTANLDTGGSFSSSTTYYIYANCDASATTFTVTISLNSSTPSGVTNYKILGNFTTDGSGNIANIIDNAVVAVQSIANYGTSTSAFTPITGNMKIRVGQTSSIAPGGSVSITNLPFTSSSSYQVAVSIASTSPGMGCIAIPSSGSSLTISANSVSSGSNSNITCNWIAIGS